MPATKKKAKPVNRIRKHLTNGHATNGKHEGNGDAQRSLFPEPEATPNLPADSFVALLKSLGANPFQPRKTYDHEEIQSLAESLKRHGQLQAVGIRPLPKGKKAEPIVKGGKPTHYVVFGMRRCIAAGAAGWDSVQVVETHSTEGQARVLSLIENDERSDLNDLERADAYAAIIEAEGIGPTQLAKDLGRSQAYVSNLLRLRKLPETWRARIISGEIAPSAARDLVPLADCPDILNALEDQLANARTDGETIGEPIPIPTGTEWTQWVTQNVIRATRPLDRDGPPGFTGGAYQVCLFKPSAAELKALAPIEWADQQRATNTALWDELQAKAREKQKGKLFSGAMPDPVESDLLDSAESAETAAGDDADLNLTMEQLAGDEPAPAGRPGQEHEPADANKLRARVDEWKIDWLAWLCAKHLKPGSSEATALLLAIAAEYGHTTDHWHTRCQKRSALLAQIVKDETGKECPPVAGQHHPPHPLAALPFDTIKATSGDFLRRCFWDATDDRPAGLLAPAFITTFATRLSIDLVDAWRKDKAGPLTEAFFQLHNRKELTALGTELGVYIEKMPTKEAAVKKLLDAPSATMACPSILLPPAEKKKRKPSPRPSPAKGRGSKGKAAKKSNPKRKAK